MTPPTKKPKSAEHAKAASLIDLASIKSPKAAKTFTDMPAEILREIAKLLNKRDMSNFRLASKEACAHTLDIFAKTNLAHLRHHLTEPSLRDLVRITEDNIFAAHVKSIEFSTARTKNPSRWYGWSKDPNPLDHEDIEFRQKGDQVGLLITVLQNLKLRGNDQVRLGVFDSICYDGISNIMPEDRISPSIFGHGYMKSYGDEAVLLGADPYGTMFAISEAAKKADYSLQHLSITTPPKSPTQAQLMKDDRAKVFFIKGSLKPNLTIAYTVLGTYDNEPRFTVKVQTGSIKHLSLQGRAWSKAYLIHDRAKSTGQYLDPLNQIINDTKYQRLTLKDIQFECGGITLMRSWTMHQTFEDLDFSGVTVNLENDLDLDVPLAVTFLKHFKTRYSIKRLKICDFTVARGFDEDTETLVLAKEEIVAEGYYEVQEVFDNLIAQVMAW
ncbi:hypothetical protein KCU93_g2668, partial [Aureobasidium melanogenum]